MVSKKVEDGLEEIKMVLKKLKMILKKVEDGLDERKMILKKVENGFYKKISDGFEQGKDGIDEDLKIRDWSWVRLKMILKKLKMVIKKI